mmetsp:Transcript_7578/g.16581  ORF Transcript_7578/g.16581 Transcript_7578/m.16581 type:complete len:639 (-) Transcript_7578:95-2011(-)
MGQGQGCGSSSSGCCQALGDDRFMVRAPGKKKALLIGINYRGSMNELRGCINDVTHQQQVLKEHYDFADSEMMILTEDQAKEKYPTKSVIHSGLRWLKEGMNSGDLLFVHYSGHGSQFTLPDNTVADCICPLDSLEGKWPDTVILDTEIHRELYDTVPSGARCIAIFDCCHSGTIANLDVKRALPVAPEFRPKPRFMTPPKSAGVKTSLPRPIGGIRRALVSGKLGDHLLWVFSGCQDDETSADAYEDGQFQGAFTWGLVKSLKFDSCATDYVGLLEQIRENIDIYPQTPALTTTKTDYLTYPYLGKDLAVVNRLLDSAVEVPTGRKKALLIGCNYRGKKFELRGCANDAKHRKSVLMQCFGYKESDILILSEDEPRDRWPYKQNILAGIAWLLDNATDRDMLVFHFSGHGSRITDSTGSDPSGFNDVICPLDCDRPWPESVISDFEIHEALYDRLPPGARLECFYDCCHAGKRESAGSSYRDSKLIPMVPEEYNRKRFLPPPEALTQPGNSFAMSPLSCVRSPVKVKKGKGFRLAVQTHSGYKEQQIWTWTACQRDQAAADCYEDAHFQGAFTWAFLRALEANAFSARQSTLMQVVRRIMGSRYPQQVPAMSTTNRNNFDRFHLGNRQPMKQALCGC